MKTRYLRKSIINVFFFIGFAALVFSLDIYEDEKGLMVTDIKFTITNVYTTVVDILADNIEKFSTILNVIRRTDNVNYLNELENTPFTIILPVNEHLGDISDIDIKSFDIEQYIIFEENIDFRENVTANSNGLVIKWGDYPLIFESLKNTVLFYQQRNILNLHLDNSKTDFKTHGEILNLNKDLLDKPSKQDCQLYESTSWLPFPKVNLPSFFEVYDGRYYQLSLLSQLLHFYEKDFEFMRTFINNTLLVVTDGALEKNFKNSIELNYIFKTNHELILFDVNFGDTAKSELISNQKMVLNNLLVHGLLGNGLKEPGSVESLNGETPFELIYSIHDNGYGISINEFHAESLPNIISYKDLEDLEHKNGERFGLSYIFDGFDINTQSLDWNLQKYLIGLSAYDFLQEMYFRDLSYLLKEDREMTLFISIGAGFDYQVPFSETNDNGYNGYNKKNLLYHFVEKNIFIDKEFEKYKTQNVLTKENVDEYETLMFDSMFCRLNKQMGKSCQKLKFYKNSENQYFINSPVSYNIKNVNSPIIVNKCLIYLIDEPLELPGSMLQSMGHEFVHSSQSIIFLQNLNLLNLPPNDVGYTIFVPDDDAWMSLDLNLEYFKKNISILNKIWKKFIWEGLFYTDHLQISNYTNLNKDFIEIVDFQQVPGFNNQIRLVSESQNFTVRKGKDIIFEQGVIQPVSHIEYPLDIQITLKNLLDTTNNGLDFLIFLREIPELMTIVDQNLGYSFIVPTSSAMLKDDQFNVNSTDFIDLMKLHVIHPNSTELIKKCNSEEMQISTLLNGVSLYCKTVDVGSKTPSLFLIMKNKQGDEKKLRILQKGCQTNNQNSCIYIVDDAMSLKWLNSSPILELHLNLSWQSFLMGLLVGGFCFFGVQVVGLGINKYQKDLAEVDYDEFDDNDADDLSQGYRSFVSARSNVSQQSLLHNENNQKMSLNYGSVNFPNHRPTVHENITNNFEAGYSENSQTKPITVQQKKAQLFSTD